MSRQRRETLHSAALIAFAALLGLFEGPAEGACVAVLVTTLLTGRLRALEPHPILMGALIWVIAGVPGVATAEVHVSSQGYLRPLHALALLVGGYGLHRVSPRVLTMMAWAFGTAIVANGAYGLLQAKVGALPWDDLLMATKNSGQVFVPGSRTVRCASGLFYNRIRLAHVGAFGLSLLALVAMRLRGQGPRLRILVGGGLLILLGALLLTYARMVLAAWVLALALLVLLLSRPRRIIPLAVASGVVLLAVGLTEAGRDRIMASSGDLRIRARIFSMALRVFEAHPWFGAGHGTYSQHTLPMLLAGWSRNWTVDAHNLYLHTLAETGVVGALGFFVALGWGLGALVRSVVATRTAPSAQDVLHRFALLCLLTIAALGVLHQPLHHASVGLVFWAAIGVAGLAPTDVLTSTPDAKFVNPAGINS